MNAYNQDNPNYNTLSRYKYEGRDDPFRLLVKKYSSDVQDTIIGILQKTKKMSEHDAYNFTNDMFSIDDKRQKDISDEVEDCYTDGKTLKQCAEQLIDKYYKIAKVNRDVHAFEITKEYIDMVREKIRPEMEEYMNKFYINRQIKNDCEVRLAIPIKNIIRVIFYQLYDAFLECYIF